jgi:hypothetical protein
MEEAFLADARIQDTEHVVSPIDAISEKYRNDENGYQSAGRCSIFVAPSKGKTDRLPIDVQILQHRDE